MKPPNVTLDNMCIIDLEQSREDASQIKRLIQMHHDKEISLRVVAASASELKQDRSTHPQHLDEFKQRLSLIGLSDVEILPTLARSDFSFSGYCVSSGRWLDELEKEIQTVLFGENEVEFGDFCRKYRYDEKAKEWDEWVHRKCDVLTLWSHIWYGGDIFDNERRQLLQTNEEAEAYRAGGGKNHETCRSRENAGLLACSFTRLMFKIGHFSLSRYIRQNGKPTICKDFWRRLHIGVTKP